MKKKYISPEANYIERREITSGKHIGMGGFSIGTDTMHADVGYFDEDADEENWTQVGNLWDSE